MPGKAPLTTLPNATFDQAYNEVARLYNALREHHDALLAVAPMTQHVRGCNAPDDPHCARCVIDSELARLDEETL